MSRWTRTAWLVLLPALLVSVALLGCSGDKKKGGGDGKKEDTKKDDKGGGGDDEMKPVAVGSGTITGTVTLKEGVKLPIDELNAKLKEKIDKNTNKNACKQAYEQTTWLVDKGKVQNVVVWIMPEKENQFFDAKELAMKKKDFNEVVVLDQPHCHFEPRIVVLFPAYIEPTQPKTAEGDVNYVATTQKFYAVNPTEISHNTKLDFPKSGGDTNVNVNQVVDKSTKAKPEKGLNLTAAAKGIRPYDITKGPIQISCKIHDWMEGHAWALPHPLADVTNAKGEFKIANVPDSGKVRIFVWHEGAGFINKDGDAGEVIDLKDTKKDFTISKLK